MEGSFLHSLTDTGSVYVFGQSEAVPQSIFLQHWTDPDSIANLNKYVQFYHGHELKPTHTQSLPRNNLIADWFFPLILITLLAFVWLRQFYARFFYQMIQAFLNNNLANQIVRDENIFVQRATTYLSFVFYLIAALLLYLLSMRFDWPVGSIGTGFGRFIFFVVIVAAAYSLKFLVLKICGWLFELEREMATYVFNIFLINNILGMILLPLICLIAYNEALAFSWVLFIPVILIGMAIAWRIFRGLQIGLGLSSVSPLYLFLYLCTLEIAPLLVLIRIIV